MNKVKKLVSDYVHERNRSYNLNLYLDYVRSQAPELFDDMFERFSGMPGYVQGGEQECRTE